MLPEKEDLKMEDITDPGYMHAKRVCKEFEKKLGKYHDLNFQGHTLFLADVF